ncbi:Structural maintenance of chromosomes protein 4 [Malassezia yamatoensis]|uniref:Structural maintenance of chromosomes protein n=1 Tax=Malassezia yamatoensis TaxID=253288 RepID=A0AAJ6CJ96_9BASI|nr:Structural maintenance of chromosomes protein 4 [Malassezia yamatoensis]
MQEEGSNADAQAHLTTVPATPSRNRAVSNRLAPQPFATPFRTPARRPIAPTPSRTTSRFARTPGHGLGVAASEPQRRLVIHKLVLENFKSYAGRQEIGPFHKSFSSVVGPNGSGKSNVIDALLFVFGWRANKMRQGKLSELIHNRDGIIPPSHCTVEVWFREIEDVPDSETYRVVPNSRLILTRTAQRNNASQYTLNGKRSSFTEVTNLLRERGIDLDHKRFLILQGEVESIAQMPAKAKNQHEEGLLEYLEDIIGTSEYKRPIEEHAQAVDTANEARAEKLHRVKIVQRELDHLEPRRRDAEQYLRNENKRIRHQSALWQHFAWKARTSSTEITQNRQALESRWQAESQKHADAQSQSESVQKEFDTLHKSIQQLQTEADALAKQLSSAEKQQVEVSARLKLLETKRKKFLAGIQDAEKQQSEAQAAAQNADEQLTNTAEQISKHEVALEKEQAALQSLCLSLESKTRSFNQAIEAKQQELAPWVEKIQQESSKRDVAKEEYDLLLSRLEEHTQQRQQAEIRAKELQEEIQDQLRDLDALRTEHTELQDKSDEDAAQVDSMRTQQQQYKHDADRARRAADDAAQALASTTTQSEILQSLNRQVELGLLQGLHGRLGSLGAIDDRYDRAVSTACRALNDLVVDSVEVAQQCIEHLRKQNLGRARFLVLDKIRANPKAMAKNPTPENAPRLFDLIKCKQSEYARVFYSELGDTLVASDLQQATRIAYGAKRWRVVTEDGQVIDKSGTMSGGGGRPREGLMSSQLHASDVSPEQVQQLKRTAQLAQQQLESHTRSLTQLESMYQSSQARLSELPKQIKRLEMQVNASKQRGIDAEQYAAALKHAPESDQNTQHDANRIQALEQSLKQHSATVQELEQSAEKIQRAIQDVQEEILEVGGVELRTLQSKVEGVQGMLQLSSEAQSKQELAKAKAEYQLKQAEQAIHTNQEQLHVLETEINSLKQVQAKQQTDIDQLRQRLEAFKDDIEEKTEVRSSLQAQLDENNDRLQNFRQFEKEAKQQLANYAQKHTELQNESQKWHEKHRRLQLHDVLETQDSLSSANHAEVRVKQEQENTPEESSEAEKQSQLSDDCEASDSRQTPATQGSDTEQDPAAYVSKPSCTLESLELPELDENLLATLQVTQVQASIEELEATLANDSVNLDVLEEFRKTEETYLSRARDLELTTNQRDEAQAQLDRLRKERLDRFMHGFTQISLKLKEMYQTITLGGNAELELVDSLDPFSEGILFSVMPPKKSWKNISNLSGGEKTLSSLALVFALHAYKPTPLYVMDEIDAALDFRNVSIIANIIKERTRGAQFIIISLRNNMFELSSRLVGVYKTQNCTKSLAIENTDLHQSDKSKTGSKTPSKIASSPNKVNGDDVSLL